MRMLRCAFWPVFVGALGGLAALEGHLGCDQRMTPHYGLSIDGEVCLWLVVGLLGPSLWLALERPTLVRRIAELPRRPSWWQLTLVAVLSLIVGGAAGVGATKHLGPLATIIAPWMLSTPPWAAFLTASFLSALLLLLFATYPRLMRILGWRMTLATGVALSVYLGLGSRFELWPEWYWPGRL